MPILEPEESYELFGTTPHVVFPTGAVVIGDDIHVYYGCADSYIAVAIADKKKLVDYILGR
jgi:predicted GH43/DUF377 family glycosyl hydrolase